MKRCFGGRTMRILSLIVLGSSGACVAPANPQSNQTYEFNDAHVHLTNNIQEGPSIRELLEMMGRTVGRAWELAEAYGMTRFCRNVRACEIPVLALEDPASDAFAAIVAESRRAVADDGAEAIVLGCAGMADLTARMTEAIGVPVIDGVAAATKTVEGLVAMGLRTSARAEFAPPLPKAYTGLLTDFEIGKPDIC